MSLRISELCLSFSPHPNISDRNSNLVHHLIRVQIFQINEEERESKKNSDGLFRIFDCPQHPKNR